MVWIKTIPFRAVIGKPCSGGTGVTGRYLDTIPEWLPEALGVSGPSLNGSGTCVEQHLADTKRTLADDA